MSDQLAGRDEALDLLEECVYQLCLQSEDLRLDSGCLKCAADALRFLSRMGRMTIVSDDGKRVIAEFAKRK